jgi:L-threonylcarbamoyladenylate synthase
MKDLTWNTENIEEIANYLLNGAVAIIPTETLYGILCKAKNKQTVEKIYQIKGRNPNKPVIILIGHIDDLKIFKIKLSKWQKTQIKKYWPGKVSIILPCFEDKFEYLHRGTESLAFRLPKDHLLGKLLKITGPLIAPSANPEGKVPGLTIKEIQKYFGEKIDLYVNGGERNSPPSTLISLLDDKLQVFRGILPLLKDS